MLRIHGERILLAEIGNCNTETALREGNYHAVDPRIDSVSFPMSVTDDTLGVYWASYPVTVRTDDLERELRALGFGFAGHQAILSLGISHPRLGMENPVAALGSHRAYEFFESRSLVIVSVAGRREARTAPRNNWWHSGWRFLVELLPPPAPRPAGRH